MRFGRGMGSQEYIGDDPSFWPVRGRRDDGRSAQEQTTHPGKRIGRRSKEEGNGVFWAGRGRSFEAGDFFDPDNIEFWQQNEEPPTEANYLEDPRWVWLVRRKPTEEDNLLCSAKSRNEKREILRQNLCHPKRKSGNLLREIPKSDQFWPLRGKRNGESWNEGLRDLKTFWPARGRRKESENDIGKTNPERK